MKRLFVFSEWLWELLKLHFYWIAYVLRGVVVLGLFPATVAVYSVVRNWFRQDGEKAEVKVLFKKYYQENFKNSNSLGWLFSFLGIMVYLNWAIFPQLNEPIIKYIGYGVIIFFTISLVFSFVFINPVMAHYKLTFMNYFIVALKLSIQFFPYTLIQIFLIGVYLFLVNFNFSLFILFGITPIALIQIIICNGIFFKIDYEK